MSERGAARPHRVAMVSTDPFPGPAGAAGWGAELSRALLAAGHEVHLWSPPGEPDLEVPEGLAHHPVAAGPASLDLALGVRLARELPRVAPTVVHAQGHRAALAARPAAARQGVPLIYQVHGALAETLPARVPALGPLVGTAGSLLDYLLPRLVEEVAVLDEAASERLRRNGHPAPTVLPPGVVRSPPGPKDPRPTVLYAGSLGRTQDLGRLADAFRRLHTRRHGTRLLVITPDPSLGGLTHLEGLEVRGGHSWPEISAQLGRGWVGVVPRGGGASFPMKLLAYLGAGLPVVATRLAAKGLGHREGVHRVPAEAQALAEGLERVLYDRELRERLAQGARVWAEAHPWSRVAEAATALYDRAVARRRGSRAAGPVPPLTP